MRKMKRPGPKDWSVIATVIIAGGTLIWTILAHFIPPAESGAKPTEKSAEAATVTAIASGTGSVGYVNGGTVNITVPSQEHSNSGPLQSQP